MKVTAIQRAGPGGRRLSIHLDGEPRLSLPDEVVLKSGIEIGGDLKEKDLVRLRATGAAWEAREAALALLNRRARSRMDLRRRLLAKQHPPEAVDASLDQLGRAGLLDDDQYARAFVRERLRSRPKGVAALKAELRVRGIDSGTAELAIRDSMTAEALTEYELARAAARKFRIRPGEEKDAARRRLHGFLSRRGFSGDVTRRILSERTESQDDELPADC